VFKSRGVAEGIIAVGTGGEAIAIRQAVEVVFEWWHDVDDVDGVL
jgi:hypothetical protein